jgi:lipid-binding SYLF domain-containing protein
MKPLLVAALLMTSVAGEQQTVSDEVERVQNAAAVLSELASAPDKAIPNAVLERAEAIAVFPSVKKAGFVVGGQ